MTLVSVKGLTHRFPAGNYGLSGVDLEMKSDEFILIAGKNGSGKTLLMLHIVGLATPTSGAVTFRGVGIEERIDEVRRKIGIVFQNPEAQILGQSVREDVGFGLEFSGYDECEVKRRVDDALERMSIPHLAERRPLYLSGGEQRKVALAALLARDPEVLILDEPFIGLDLPGVRSILTSLVSLRREGRTVVVISHDVGKVLAHCDRLVVMEAGKIVENGRPGELVDRLEEYDVRRPAGSVERMSWLG